MRNHKNRNVQNVRSKIKWTVIDCFLFWICEYPKIMCKTLGFFFYRFVRFLRDPCIGFISGPKNLVSKCISYFTSDYINIVHFNKI